MGHGRSFCRQTIVLRKTKHSVLRCFFFGSETKDLKKFSKPLHESRLGRSFFYAVQRSHEMVPLEGLFLTVFSAVSPTLPHLPTDDKNLLDLSGIRQCSGADGESLTRRQ